MPAKEHIIHGRDHEHGGADPSPIVWEDLVEGSTLEAPLETPAPELEPEGTA